MSRDLLVLFDGACPLCQASVRWLRRLDWLGKFTYLDVRPASEEVLVGLQVPREVLLEQMHVRTAAGAMLKGFPAVRHLACRLPVLWPIAPLLWAPGLGKLGQRMYLWVARRRFGLMPCRGDVCAWK